MGTPLPSAQATRSRVMAPRNRARGAVPVDRATAATGRRPKSANRYAAPHTTSPEKVMVNPTIGMVSGSISPNAVVMTAAPSIHRKPWMRVTRPGSRSVRTRSSSVGSRPSTNHRTRRYTADRTQAVPTTTARST